LTLALISTAAEANCPILPVERDLDYHILEDRRAVELRRRHEPKGSPLCVLQLGCRVREEALTSVSYVLRRDSILPGDIIAMRFSFSDGAEQACPVRAIHTP
jgi:hypothetical protein